MQALARNCERVQSEVLLKEARCWSTMRSCGHLQPVCFIWVAKYDESPLKTRVGFDLAQKDVQVAKVVVVEQRWSAVLQFSSPSSTSSLPGSSLRTPRPQEDRAAAQDGLLIVSATMAPQVRAVDHCTGEGLALTLESCHAPPREIQQVFPRLIRLVEVGQCWSELTL